jgi:GAF domain-containing protein
MVIHEYGRTRKKFNSLQGLMVSELSYPENFIEGDLFLKETAQYVRQLTKVMTATITYYDQDGWKKSFAGTEFGGASLPRILYRAVIQRGAYIDIEDCLKHPSYKFINLNVNYPMIRFIACFPINNQHGTITGAITLMDRKPKKITPAALSSLETISKMVCFHLLKVT